MKQKIVYSTEAGQLKQVVHQTINKKESTTGHATARVG